MIATALLLVHSAREKIRVYFYGAIFFLVLECLFLPTFLEVDRGYNVFLAVARGMFRWIDAPVAESIYRASRRWELCPYFMTAHIHAESRGYKYAVSNKGARGLYQVMPFWTRDPDLLFIPQYNIEVGSRIYAYYLRLARGDVRKALRYYERGPRGRGENKRYFNEIISNWKVMLRRRNDIESTGFLISYL